MENQLNKIKHYFDELGVQDYKVVTDGYKYPYFKFIYNDIEYITPEISYVTFDSVKKEIDKLLNIKNINNEENFIEKEKYLRLYAEFENYRKRTIQEKEQLRKMVGSNIFKDLLEIIDDFELALQHENTPGFEILHNKFKTFLIKYNILEYGEINDEFNSDIHDAVSVINSVDFENNKIITIVKKGYIMNDLILRHPIVVVCQK